MTLDQFRLITKQSGWLTYAKFLLNEQTFNTETIDQFGTYWIEGGHRMREQIMDDRMLVRLLRHILPSYCGRPIELFRGENRSRWESGNIGFAWTTNIATARIFGCGLNAVSTGGVLLKAYFEPQTIISGPNAHSKYLGEDQFTVDPFSIGEISVIEFLPGPNY